MLGVYIVFIIVLITYAILRITLKPSKTYNIKTRKRIKEDKTKPSYKDLLKNINKN